MRQQRLQVAKYRNKSNHARAGINSKDRRGRFLLKCCIMSRMVRREEVGFRERQPFSRKYLFSFFCSRAGSLTRHRKSCLVDRVVNTTCSAHLLMKCGLAWNKDTVQIFQVRTPASWKRGNPDQGRHQWLSLSEEMKSSLFKNRKLFPQERVRLFRKAYQQVKLQSDER